MRKPLTIENTLLHVKSSNNEEKLILPITNYANVMNSPRISSPDELVFSGQPYAFVATGTKMYTEEEIKKMGAPIIKKVDIRATISE